MIELVQDMLGIPRGRRAQRAWLRRYLRSLVYLVIGITLGAVLIAVGLRVLFSIRWSHSWSWIIFETAVGLLVPIAGLTVIIMACLMHEHRTAAQLLPPRPRISKKGKIRCPACRKRVLLAPFCKKCGRSLRDCV